MGIGTPDGSGVPEPPALGVVVVVAVVVVAAVVEPVVVAEVVVESVVVAEVVVVGVVVEVAAVVEVVEVEGDVVVIRHNFFGWQALPVEPPAVNLAAASPMVKPAPSSNTSTMTEAAAVLVRLERPILNLWTLRRTRSIERVSARVRGS